MRSSGPLPGNPWPHDMVITVEDDLQPLLDLLWIREAWNLSPVGLDLPPLLVDDSGRAQAKTEPSDVSTTWSDAWPSRWEKCVHHASLTRDSAIFEQLKETKNGSRERAELLQTIVGPSWRDEFGGEAFTEEYESWNLVRFEVQARRQPRSLAEEPERMSLDALISAWRAGLIKIVTIPCRGSYTHRIGEHALLMTEETRNDPNRYAAALDQFR